MPISKEGLTGGKTYKEGNPYSYVMKKECPDNTCKDLLIVCNKKRQKKKALIKIRTLMVCLLLVYLEDFVSGSPYPLPALPDPQSSDLSTLQVLHREKRQFGRPGGRGRGRPPGGRRRPPPPRYNNGGSTGGIGGILSNPAVQGFKGGFVGGVAGSLAAPAITGAVTGLFG